MVFGRVWVCMDAQCLSFFFSLYSLSRSSSLVDNEGGQINMKFVDHTELCPFVNAPATKTKCETKRKKEYGIKNCISIYFGVCFTI